MKTIHLVSHTHWDREWYRPFQYFRARLVFLIDKVLKILEDDPDYKFFLLDGQSIPLEDYLQVRPEQREILKKYIRAGRLIVGPWYIQPDEFAPDGESQIRNLLIGISIAEEFGEPMMVGYLPDSFGQSGGMPQILRGFGMDSAVFMRGMPTHILPKSEFIWEGVNGDRVLGIYLPMGYSNAMFLPKSLPVSNIRLRETIRRLGKWATTGQILLMNGVDHQFPQEHIPALIRFLNEKNKKFTFIHSTIERYIHDVRAEAPELETLKGDLLSPNRNRVHSSIASTRIYQKQENRRLEALLEKYVEPISTLAWLQGADYPAGLIRQAWKTMIQNQTHDGLCGCCTDAVHREMDQRFIDVAEIGNTILKQYSRALAQNMGRKEITFLVFNSAMTRGRQLVWATIYAPSEKFTLVDETGASIPYQVRHSEEVDVSTLSIWTLYLSGKNPMHKMEIAFYLDFDFNVGYRVLTLKKRTPRTTGRQGIAVQEDHTFENDFYRLQALPDGSLTLYDKETGTAIEDLLVFEDCGDAGDTYNYSPVREDTRVLSKGRQTRISVLEQGPVYTSVLIEQVLPVPEKLVDNDVRRSEKQVSVSIRTTLNLYTDLKRIDCRTEIENRALDHRIRVLFNAGVTSTVSNAETQFGTIQRPNTVLAENWEKAGWKEKPLPIYSQQRFVDLNDGVRGLAILNKGLPEYEIYEGTTIAITLVRGVGMMGKGGLLIRPGRPSGMSFPTPDAQCLGKRVLEYAIFPHSGDTDGGRVAAQAAQFEAPALVVQNRIHKEKLISKEKVVGQFLEIESFTDQVRGQLQPVDSLSLSLMTVNREEILISAVKKAEKELALVVRVYNAGSTQVDGVQLQFGKVIKAACLTDFSEKDKDVLSFDEDNLIILPAIPGYTAKTIKIYFQG